MIAEDGTEAEYDRLLLATGSTPFILPVPGKDLPGVITYRDIADTEAMIEAARHHQHAVVIGGGLLGLEAANGLKLRGMDVTVVHLMPTGSWNASSTRPPPTCCRSRSKPRASSSCSASRPAELIAG